MPTKSTPPVLTETAFDCPHCGAYTTQNWIELQGKFLDDKRRVPTIPDRDWVKRLEQVGDELDQDTKSRWIAWAENMWTGDVFLQHKDQGVYAYNEVHNLFLSACYNCKKFAVWVHDRLVHPSVSAAPPANPDLPPDVLRDYEEAGRIVNESPRGATGLLRLGIQKICMALGGKGDKIDDDIAALVKKGLNPMVQQALDGVRVIGNEAVHPGTLDLRDDRETAIKLFKLVNIIAEQMISNPKHVAEIYGMLPEGKRNAIAKRDGRS